ncbi:bacillithiol biosynthesis deacetylase BshB1 [Paenibacillus sp. 32O-W]|uniref:bacillithiol biosynthesis deacetylase BshB1 n=1 Tax=Paenibacillus sp. 32O-W TaxID=1695218 RepID=UPI0011A7CDCB|nr:MULTISPECIES: bacillithiol biosynthesis deacetylase BshB1 [Paenibacillaceae]
MTKSLDMLVFGAHPDDAEIGMGGTIAKHVEAGRSVGICDLTFAEMSSNGTVETRKREAAHAAKALGVTLRANLGLPDRGLQLIKEQLDEITLAIRRYKPRMVFCPYWEDRHPDHVLCSRMVQEAVFSAKLRNYLPDTEAHSVEQVYFYFINDAIDPDVMIDISSQYSKKREALMAYRSQFEPAEASRGQVKTPLNQGYLDNVEARDRLLGQKRLVPYAEGFVSKLPLIVNLF